MKRTPGGPVLVVAMLASGCGGGAIGARDPGLTPDPGPAEVAEVSWDGAEAGPDGAESWVEAGAEAETVAEDQGSGADDRGDAVEADAGPVCPGGVGCPCNEPGDCDSTYCIPTMKGSVCSVSCISGDVCPEHWTCEVCVGGGDPQYCCVDPFPSLCKPCKTDQDCVSGVTGGKTGLCIEHGPDGRFCGVACETDADCPDGVDGTDFVCAEVLGKEGLTKQCQPVAGQTCPCTDKYKKNGYLTVCYVENEVGRCTGERTCETACSAKEPLAETCNLEDDDCNGKTDDAIAAAPCPLENTFGTCMGKTVCANGQEICQGAYAAAEMCNGHDDDCDGGADEGFPDLEGDGIADCSDLDDDGDGVEDATDNCPLVANEGQEDMDLDDLGDACDCDWDSDGVANMAGGCPVVVPGDNCPVTSNKDQKDLDTDGLGDACDCDLDGDGVENDTPAVPLDPAAACPGPAQPDNCPAHANSTQLDADLDGTGDACDCDMDGDGVGNPNPGCTTPAKPDNCPMVPNPDQGDVNKDGVGDACACDQDGDGFGEPKGGCPEPDPADNCPYIFNSDQSDDDLDGLGNACDCDIDEDGVANLAAGCPACADACDNCPYTPNAGQEDMDHNGKGDACEGDWDDDQVLNDDDNCPLVANPGQEDLDVDGIGDQCDDDMDGDGVPNVEDRCAMVQDPLQEDMDRDGAGDACDPDIDGDLDPNAGDCSPLDPTVSHFAVETCNGRDDNCNGIDDEEGSVGCLIFFYDGDRDQFGGSQQKCLCEPVGFYDAATGGDCNDSDPEVRPGAREVCGNAKDDNCNWSENDENAQGCSPYYYDWDQDNWGTALQKCLCTAVGEYRTRFTGDCDDKDPSVNPNQKEDCSDEKDNDCSGSKNDENAINSKVFYLDEDDDSYGTGQWKRLCFAGGAWRASQAGDCDDQDSAVNPAATEACLNGKDDNCDGKQDDPGSAGCTFYFADADGDTYGNAGSKMCLCVPFPPFTAGQAGDCNDVNENVHPGAPETCNGVDENCSGAADEGDPLQTCGAAIHGTYVCEDARCVIAACEGGWFDVNGSGPDGCECQQDAGDVAGGICEDANDIGDIEETGLSTAIEGRIVSATDVDWYRFRAVDSTENGTIAQPGRDGHHVSVTLVYPSSGKSILFQVVRGSCQEAPVCGGDWDRYEWYADFDGLNASSQPVGEDPCLTQPAQQGGTGLLWACQPGETCCGQGSPEICQLPGYGRRYCLDDTSSYFLKVYWAPGVPFTKDCNGTAYAISVQNGK